MSIITPFNDRHYDTRNFDTKNNYYAILVDKKQLKINKDIYEQGNDKLYVTYNNIQTLLVYVKIDSKDNIFENGYKIIYGHFYNDQNFFLFKNLNKEGKIIGHKIHKVQKSELYSKLNRLYFSNYYTDISRTSFLLNKQIKDTYTKDVPALEIKYDYIDNNEEIRFYSSIKTYFDIEYEDELLKFDKINDKIIVLK